MYEEPNGGRVVAEVDGVKAFIIRPGFVSWPRGTWAVTLDVGLISGPGGLMIGQEGDGTMWAQLSTFRDVERANRTKRDDIVRPTCNVALPATGMCDNCS